MILSQITKSKIEKVLGKEIRYSSDYDCLAIDIEDRTHEHIGVNTLKRLLGDIPASNEPRLATLDVIAKYLITRAALSPQSACSTFLNQATRQNSIPGAMPLPVSGFLTYVI